MFKADSGKILINGHDVNEYDKQELFSMFCVVFQEVNILALTIAQNIACAVDDIDYARVDEVLKQVDLYDKVHSLEKGVNSMMLKII
jgi:ABC-type transport system involved in cytochrome bd biosynthesis fused ATPase/permease subunit